MIVNKEEQLKYLYAFKDGKIQKGMGIGCEYDNYYVHKKGTMTVVIGLDNVGKTFFLLWYFLCLSVKHNVKWCIWSGENSAGQLTRDLIQMYSQKEIKNLTKPQIQKYYNIVSNWFTFISNKKMYNHKDLLKISTYTLEYYCNAKSAKILVTKNKLSWNTVKKWLTGSHLIKQPKHYRNIEKDGSQNG